MQLAPVPLRARYQHVPEIKAPDFDVHVYAYDLPVGIILVGVLVARCIQ